MREHSYALLLETVVTVCLVLVGGCGDTNHVPVSIQLPSRVDGPVAEAPQLAVGDTWLYSDGISEEVREVRPNGSVVEHHGASRFRECVDVLHEKDLHGTVFAVRDLTGEEVSECDHFKGWRKLDFPLFIGKKWAFEADDISQSLGRMCSYRNEMEVVAYERVTVSAGSFDAFKILHNQQNLCRDTGVWNTRFYWYAPDARAIVKTMNWNNRIKNQLIQFTTR